jgi:hypothetical protein
VLLIALFVWGGTAIATDDALWFLPVFDVDAAFYTIYWDSEQITVEPGTPEYEMLNAAFHEDLAHVSSHPSGVGLSDSMYNHLQQAGRLVEAHYDERAMVHSPYHFGASPLLLVPLSTHHAWNSRLFNRGRGAPLQLQSTAQIMGAVETIVVESGLGSP